VIGEVFPDYSRAFASPSPFLGLLILLKDFGPNQVVVLDHHTVDHDEIAVGRGSSPVDQTGIGHGPGTPPEIKSLPFSLHLQSFEVKRSGHHSDT
jgi:hypothetical protein